MTPLDANGLKVARLWFANGPDQIPVAEMVEGIVRAYLSATLPSEGMGVVAFDGVAKQKLAGLIERGWKISGYSLYQEGDHGLITTGGFVGWFSVAERNEAAARAELDQAQAALAGMKGERDEAQTQLALKSDILGKELDARRIIESEVKRLTEEKDGLEKEETRWYLVAQNETIRADTAEAHIRALIDLIDQFGSAKLIALAKSTLQGQRSNG